MTYLHGDIDDSAALHYEYARESVIILEAATIYKADKETFEAEGRRRRVSAIFGGAEIWDDVNQKLGYSHDSLLYGFPPAEWGFIWQCPSFPDKSWHELSTEERKEIKIGFGRIAPPLATPSFVTLKSSGVLDFWMSKAHEIGDEIMEKGHSNESRAIAVAVDWPSENFAHLVVTLPLDQSSKELTRRFNRTVRQKEIRELLQSRSKKSVGAIKDRLKDLATWRLYRHFRWDDARDFADAHRLPDRRGNPRAFHDPRHGQTCKRELYEAPLFSEKSGFENAKRRAVQWIAENMPWEVRWPEGGAFAGNDQTPLTFHTSGPEEEALIVHHGGEWRPAERGDEAGTLKVFPTGSQLNWRPLERVGAAQDF